mgnify:CR=1 FL=1|jgi:hypothetical protein|tara:strand:- start:356 stop:688 length:333 start_codon:yes stop_codon:yes gene_type:complete
MQLQKEVLIDVSADANNSSAAQCDGLLLSGIVFPAAMTGTAVTFDFAFDGSTWVDVVETDGTEVSYTVTAGDVVRVDPSGWAFATAGSLRITSNATEAADRTINLIFKQS